MHFWRSSNRRRAGITAGGLLVAALALTACSGGGGTTSGPSRGSVAPSASPTGTPSSTLPPLASTPAPLATSATSPPVQVTIPALGVTSSLEGLGLQPDGSLATPSQWQVAGWYDQGTKPGDVGPAIIAGHVDSYMGPAVFYRLRDLKAGDQVQVGRADGSTLTFTVTGAAQYPKAQFPTEAVYGPTPTPELKLVTCTGIFDRSVRSYEDNLVVTSVLTSSTGA